MILSKLTGDEKGYLDISSGTCHRASVAGSRTILIVILLQSDYEKDPMGPNYFGLHDVINCEKCNELDVIECLILILLFRMSSEQ